ncbi:LytR/AlgR family response regulator transcription factor [Sediminitomix flava]|uniref:LytTR family two component transcriptional regulator n=1 Tax=Sediminitomix flava TaxID=379075 RepID=A0A315Z860_SEDFL|nr:LytTR family DNA-binding domain-containing protein [Sediminitomix flava]PWJ41047.1 LytTR family two component transcriptional regulator [Sediminitomix flava]
MYKVLIVEDEAPSARKLKMLLGKLSDEFEVVELLESIEECVEFFETGSTIDLIFMDIHLSDGNSFEIFEKMDIETPIIFTTAFDQYAIKAFKQNSVDYLLKPINLGELEESVSKFKKLYGKRDTSTEIDYNLLGQIVAKQVSPEEYKERFMVSYRDELKSISVNEIAFVFAESKAVFIQVKDGKCYDINYTMDQVEKNLNPKDFFRINRKYIVHISAIQSVSWYSKTKLKVFTDPETPSELFVPADKMSKFKDWLNK